MSAFRNSYFSYKCLSSRGDDSALEVCWSHSFLWGFFYFMRTSSIRKSWDRWIRTELVRGLAVLPGEGTDWLAVSPGLCAFCLISGLKNFEEKLPKWNLVFGVSSFGSETVFYGNLQIFSLAAVRWWGFPWECEICSSLSLEYGMPTKVSEFRASRCWFWFLAILLASLLSFFIFVIWFCNLALLCVLWGRLLSTRKLGFEQVGYRCFRAFEYFQDNIVYHIYFEWLKAEGICKG